MGFFDNMAEEAIEEKVEPLSEDFSTRVEEGQAFIKEYNFDIDVTGVLDEKTKAALAKFFNFQMKWNKITIDELEDTLNEENPHVHPMLPRLMKAGLLCWDHEIPGGKINGNWGDEEWMAWTDWAGDQVFVDAVEKMFFL